MTTPDSRLPLNGAAIKSMNYTLYDPYTDADRSRTDQLVQRVKTFQFTDANTAATAVAEEVVLVPPFSKGIKVLGVTVSLNVTATASDTLYATFTVAQRLSDGSGSATTIATQTTKTSGSGGLGSLTTLASYALPITAAAAVVPYGSSVTFALAKASTGTKVSGATGSSNITILYEEL